MRQAERQHIAHPGGRHGEEECDGRADLWRPVCLECGLPQPQGEASGDRGDDDGPECTSAAVVGREACVSADNLCGVLRYVALA